jgi:acyl carrier protein
MQTPGIVVTAPAPAELPLDEAGLRAWMAGYVARHLGIDAAAVDTSARFDSFGLDSVEAVVMAGVMEEEFGVAVEPALLLAYPSVDLFAAANCRRR